jgi:uncharacterized protein (DUF2336 family)
MQAPAQLDALLVDKSDAERARIARKAAQQLQVAELPADQRQAAEIIVRRLAEDAIELVRQTLSHAVSHTRSLPKDIALRIASDIDAVACPFLEVTEVFSDTELMKLVQTLSLGPLAAVARRTTLSEDLALGIVRRANPAVAHALIGNPAAPLTPRVCTPLIERFKSSTSVLDRLAERSDLGTGIAAILIDAVSQAAAQKLAVKYDLGSHAGPTISDAEILSIVRLTLKLPPARYGVIVSTLRNKRKVTPRFLELALREGPIAFFEVAVAAETGVPLDRIKSLVRRGEAELLTRMFQVLKLPADAHVELLQKVMDARERQDWLRNSRLSW